MDTTPLNPNLVRITTESLNAFARHLDQTGRSEMAEDLIKQAAQLELLSPELQLCWGGPFNGQEGRLAIVAQLLAAVNPAAIVETGTYRGISTRWFADHFNGPVWSCEKEELYLIQARHRLRDSKNVQLELADSRAFLRRLAPALDVERSSLFYLDAHWERDLPLRDELRIIFSAQPKAVVLIDDFRVPDDPGYGWDDYGPDRVVDVSQLVDTIPRSAALYFPTLASSQETGAKRGCCVVAGQPSGDVDHCYLLRRWSLSDALSISHDLYDRDEQNRRLHDVMLVREDDVGSVDPGVLAAVREELRKVTLQAHYRLNDVNLLTERVAALQAQLDLLGPEHARLRNQVDSLTTQLSMSESECANRLQGIEVLDAEVLRLRAAEEECAKRLAQSEARDAERIASLQAQLDLIGPEHALLRSQVDSLTTQLSLSEGECAKRLQAIQVLDAEVLRLRAAEEECANRLAQSEARDAERIASLQAQLDLIGPEHALLRSQVDSLTKQMSTNEHKGASQVQGIEVLDAEVLRPGVVEPEYAKRSEQAEATDSERHRDVASQTAAEPQCDSAVAEHPPAHPLDLLEPASHEVAAQEPNVGGRIEDHPVLRLHGAGGNGRSVTRRAVRLISSPGRSFASLLRRAVRRLGRAGPPAEAPAGDGVATSPPRDMLAAAPAIDLAYRAVLGRPIEPGMLAKRLEAIAAGVPFAEMFVDIASSEEAQLRAARLADEARASQSVSQLGHGLSDGKFLLTGGQLVYGRGLSPREIAAWQGIIDEVAGRRIDFVTAMINEHIARTQAADASSQALNDPTTTQILGTTRLLTQRAWEARRAELTTARRGGDGSQAQACPARRDPFVHTGTYKVSMIASLYKGGKFIRRFLENLTSQSIFDEAELIIIDANSPDCEQDVIEHYQQLFPNIVYERIGYRLGIYDAWNVGVERARGRYLTNTNLDDLRRHDSIALQAGYLDSHEEVDVVYQDFYYSFNPFLSFGEAAAFGFKSALPIIAPHNLLLSNSPHNAPMWRARLHDDVGKFDTTYRSAGDWEFWLRCLEAGKRFRKINTPHVVYYQNPDGISTRPGTAGISEGGRIFGLHGPKLISPALLLSRRDFRIGVGQDVPDGPIADKTAYFDIAQTALLSLGAARWATPASAGMNGQGGAHDERARIRVLIDGVVFQRGASEIARFWTSVLRKLALLDNVTLLMLDRGGAPIIAGIDLIEFPSYTETYTATDSLLIQEFCDEFGIDVFLSSQYTSATTTPQMQIVHDMLPEILGLDMSSRIWKEKKLALSYASYVACISNALRDDLLNIHPTIESSRIAIIGCGVDSEIFNPAAVRGLSAFRQAHGMKRPYFLWTGAHDQQREGGAKRMVEALKLDQATDFDVVWLGSPGTMEPAWLRDLPCGLTVMPEPMTDPELATAYSGALALVCASPGDSFGLSVLEAMACGCPVITIGSGSPAEVAGHAGLALSGQDARELLRALERVRTPQVRQGLIEAGLERVGDFSLERSVHLLGALLQQVTRQRCHPDEGEFHRRWKKLRVTQANVDIGLD